MFTRPKHVSNQFILTGYLWWILPLLDVSCIISPPILMTWWGTVSWTMGKGVETVPVGVWGGLSCTWDAILLLSHFNTQFCEWDSPWTIERKDRSDGTRFLLFSEFSFLNLRIVWWIFLVSCTEGVLHLCLRFVILAQNFCQEQYLIRTLDIGSLDWWSLMIVTCSNTSKRLGYWTN